jgi:YfiH family protein
MIYAEDGPLPCCRFEHFPQARLRQAVFTRRGGVSQGPYASLNVGSTVGDDPESVGTNHQLIYRAMGALPHQVVTGHQVHGQHVVAVSAEDGGQVIPETDALMTNVPGLVLLLRFADCVPVFFYSPRQNVVGLAHAGWQGTLKGIAARTAEALSVTYGSRLDELYVGLGPAIGPCCFEVGPEVLDLFRAEPWMREELIAHRQPSGKAHIDLWQANAWQLRDLGVQHISVAALCTCCRQDLFYSHRGERGHTGRFAAAIALGSGAQS